jgi:hypothetical protein
MIRGVPGVVLINRARLGRGERDEDPIWGVRGASAPCAVLVGPLLFSINAPRPLAVAFFGRCIFFEKRGQKHQHICLLSIGTMYVLCTPCNP